MRPGWPLDTERLVLRPFAEDDLGSLHAMQSDAQIARWLYNEPRTLEETRKLLALKIAGDRFTVEGNWLSAAVIERETGELAGDMSLRWLSELHKTGEIGFMFLPGHQGRGYATEAGRRILQVGFEDMGFHRVIGRTEARNTASARVLEKLGMRLEAHLVENEWVKNEWQSELVYAMLEHEWR